MNQLHFREYFNEAERMLLPVQDSIDSLSGETIDLELAPATRIQGKRLLAAAQSAYDMWLESEQIKMKAAITSWEIHRSVVASISEICLIIRTAPEKCSRELHRLILCIGEEVGFFKRIDAIYTVLKNSPPLCELLARAHISQEMLFQNEENLIRAMQADYAAEVAENQVMLTAAEAKELCIRLCSWIDAIAERMPLSTAF